jgi:hypothetical protein
MQRPNMKGAALARQPCYPPSRDLFPSGGPEALRPTLASGLPLSSNLNNYFFILIQSKFNAIFIIFVFYANKLKSLTILKMIDFRIFMCISLFTFG